MGSGPGVDLTPENGGIRSAWSSDLTPLLGSAPMPRWFVKDAFGRLHDARHHPETRVSEKPRFRHAVRG